MKKKIIFGIIGFLVVGLLAAVVLVDRGLYGKFIAGRISSHLAKNNFIVDFKKPELLLIGVEANEAQLRKNPFPFTVLLTDFKLRLPLLKLLTGAPGFSVQSNAYGGKLSTEGSVTPSSGAVSGSAKADSIQIHRHPQLEALGLKSATISLPELQYSASQGKLELLKVQLKIEDFSKPGLTNIPTFLTGGKPTFPIPPILFTTLEADIDFNSRENRIQAQKVTLIAPQGSLKGGITLKDMGGDGRFSKSSRIALDGKFTARLTQQGAKELIPLIALVTGRSVPPTARKLDLSVRGSVASAKWLVSESSS